MMFMGGAVVQWLELSVRVRVGRLGLGLGLGLEVQFDSFFFHCLSYNCLTAKSVYTLDKLPFYDRAEFGFVILYSSVVLLLKTPLNACPIFQKMDKNNDGVVTIEEFLETCQRVSMRYFLTSFREKKIKDSMTKLSYSIPLHSKSYFFFTSRMKTSCSPCTCLTT